LTAKPISQVDVKTGFSDPVVLNGMAIVK